MGRFGGILTNVFNGFPALLLAVFSMTWYKINSNIMTSGDEMENTKHHHMMASVKILTLACEAIYQLFLQLFMA